MINNSNAVNLPEAPTHPVINHVVPPVRVIGSKAQIDDDPDDPDSDDEQLKKKKRRINKGGRPKAMTTVVKELVSLANNALTSNTMNNATVEEFIKSKVPTDIGKFMIP